MRGDCIACDALFFVSVLVVLDSLSIFTRLFETVLPETVARTPTSPHTRKYIQLYLCKFAAESTLVCSDFIILVIYVTGSL